MSADACHLPAHAPTPPPAGGFGGFNFNEWGDGFKKWARGLLRTLGAVALFLGALFVMTLWRPMLQLLARLVGGGRGRVKEG